MGKTSDWPCWKIMNCGIQRLRCQAYHRPEIPCWEIAREMNDYRRLYNVCTDCIVYVSKQEDSVLTHKEIEAILEHKSTCMMAPGS